MKSAYYETMKKEKIPKEGEAKTRLEEIRKELVRAKRIVKKDVKNGTVSPRTYFFDGRWSAFDQVIKSFKVTRPALGDPAAENSRRVLMGRALTEKNGRCEKWGNTLKS